MITLTYLECYIWFHDELKSPQEIHLFKKRQDTFLHLQLNISHQSGMAVCCWIKSLWASSICSLTHSPVMELIPKNRSVLLTRVTESQNRRGDLCTHSHSERPRAVHFIGMRVLSCFSIKSKASSPVFIWNMLVSMTAHSSSSKKQNICSDSVQFYMQWA